MSAGATMRPLSSLESAILNQPRAVGACVRAPGENFNHRLGYGPCDCGPCLHRQAQAHVPYDAGADSSEGD